jgi:hypothetical protein
MSARGGYGNVCPWLQAIAIWLKAYEIIATIFYFYGISTALRKSRRYTTGCKFFQLDTT